MNRLKELRQKKGDTQEDVAKAMGVTRRGYQKWENEESQIKPEKAQQLADYFGVTTGFLLGFGTLEEELEYDRKEMYKLFQKEDDALLSLGHLLSDNDIEHVLQLIHLLSSKNESYFWKSIELKDPNKHLIFDSEFSSFAETYPNYLSELQEKYKNYIQKISKHNKDEN
ncbi:helix-turn-helix transcriptional regulator [Streptococcus infantis]|uniref:helix-turn-helix domain-containing protein n=1 Tax=Streptococcus infantis TaxID=68892 RepID=UPI0039C2085F